MNATALPLFYLKDCTLSVISTGIRAQILTEFRDKLATIHPGCIYFHFWGGRLRTTFEHWEYHNDFSYWAHKCLHDDILAERLEILNPNDFKDLEKLRNEILEIIDERLDELETNPGTLYNDQFHFVRSKIIVMDIQHQLKHPRELVEVIPNLTRSSLFYHFIDARRRLPNSDNDFSAWLRNGKDGYGELIQKFDQIDPYLISLHDVQHKLSVIVKDYFEGKK